MRIATEGITVDLSGPTACTVDAPEARSSIVARLGSDPLRDDAVPSVALDRIARRRTPIGTLLLDQSVIAGIGNVYRAEALFVNGIDPRRPGDTCSAAELESLWSTVVQMLRAGVRANRIVTVDRRELQLPKGARVRRGDATYVYHRRSCLRCAAGIETADLGGRPCWFCPGCQR
jgi:endonuclease VIII